MRTNHVSLIAFFLCFTIADVFVTSAVAQGTGQIEGVVRDEQGGVLPGAALSLRNADSGVTRTVTIESDGSTRTAATTLRSPATSMRSRRTTSVHPTANGVTRSSRADRSCCRRT